jgi:hypothetical protein
VLDQHLIDFHKNLPPGDGGLALWYTKKHYDAEARTALTQSSKTRKSPKQSKKR